MFHDLTIAEVRPEGRDAVALRFDLPDDLAAEFAFRPGQFLTLRTEINGAEVRRSYSLASPPGEELTVGIRHVDGGAFSRFAQGLKSGDHLQVMPPEGRFVWNGERDILLIAAGSGITPMVSIASTALAAGAEVTLVFGNRQMDTIMFRSALESLKDLYLERFSLIHILSRESQDVPLFEGRIDAIKIAALADAGLIAPEAVDAVFLCGPEGMIAGAEQALSDLGVAPEKLRKELFVTLGGFVLPPSPKVEAAVAGGVEVVLRLDGAERRIRMQEGDASVLDAAERQGLELPYSCRGGMCCTCRCRITEGGAEMAMNYSLEPWEVEAGFTLACQTRPTSARLALDFDAV
ncbi:MAG: 2Fe-2S iron-sulfur cluster-binding protein [Dinoroseobacter sp.]|nr:2Fe-2S iron-sulfur cluster-binding protein [Dinoroseobacter sp.]